MSRLLPKIAPALLAMLLCLLTVTETYARKKAQATATNYPYCTKKCRMDRSRINIGVYHLKPYATSESHIRDLRDCGVDFVLCMRNEKPTLDLMYKYHVGAVLYDVLPQWWPRQKKAGEMEKIYPFKMYVKAAKKWKDHPAVWGMDIGDEPSALDFPYCGRLVREMEKMFPNQFIYTCLYPNYASVAENSDNLALSQLGTSTYAEHIAAYCKHVPTDYICYDYYVYSSKNSLVPRAFENLQVVADACTGTQRSFWITLQVNSKFAELWTTENQLRYQAYTAMAFGAENIIWACYTLGWWKNQVVDIEGNKTEQYPKLQRVNAEIHRLSDHYMQYRRTNTAFVGFQGTEWIKGTHLAQADELNSMSFSHVRATDHTPLVIGSMLARNGEDRQALFICSADDPYDKAPRQHTIQFQVKDRKVKAHGGQGEVPLTHEGNGLYTLQLQSNAGVLVEIE
ncbi:MAG: hypothetical protein ILA34_00915 [Bacteroidaceae bacterium]|nr:hypothetical protein [Bacteroidaceae bacterium]